MRSAPSLQGVDKPVSRLALGTASFRLEDLPANFALLDGFAELGGTVIDSARSYGDSEAVIGAWLQSRGVRDDVLLVSKCAHGDAILPSEGFEELVGRELEQSLQTLETDVIDLYMLHRDNPAVPVGRIVERLNREVERGLVRALGASNWSYARVREANEYARARGLAGFAVVSNNLSLAEPAAPFYPNLVSTDRAGERWHEETGTPLLSWSSQARGFFTGRLVPSARAQGPGDGDPFLRRMAEVYGTPGNLERLRRAQDLARELGGVSAVQIALAWLLHKPFPLIPVVGPRTPGELASCVAALSIVLTQEQCAWLNLETDGLGTS